MASSAGAQKGDSMKSSGRPAALPPEIGKLTALTHLDLVGNRLTAQLPEI
jgi:hypothetical protein